MKYIIDLPSPDVALEDPPIGDPRAYWSNVLNRLHQYTSQHIDLMVLANAVAFAEIGLCVRCARAASYDASLLLAKYQSKKYGTVIIQLSGRIDDLISIMNTGFPKWKYANIDEESELVEVSIDHYVVDLVACIIHNSEGYCGRCYQGVLAYEKTGQRW